MIAYKFLRPGLMAPFTGFRWQPGEWVAVEHDPLPCERGIHACRPRDLPYWINRELWEIELAEPTAEGTRKVLGAKGRLLRPIEAWNAEAEAELAAACVARVRAHAEAAPGYAEGPALVEDAATYSARGRAHVVTYIAAVAAERAGGPEARRAEREWQAAWFAERVL